MPHIELDGQQFEVDEDGFLVDWQVWKEGVAGIMAKEDGLELDQRALGDHQVPQRILY